MTFFLICERLKSQFLDWVFIPKNYCFYTLWKVCFWPFIFERKVM